MYEAIVQEFLSCIKFDSCHYFFVLSNHQSMFAPFPNLNYKELYPRIYDRPLLSCRSRLKAR